MGNINNLKFSRIQHVQVVDSNGAYLMTSDGLELYGLAVVNSVIKNILTGIRGTVNLLTNSGVQLIDSNGLTLLTLSYESETPNVNFIIRMYLGDIILWDKMKWILCSDIEPIPYVKYGWVDEELWDDYNIWKD